MTFLAVVSILASFARLSEPFILQTLKEQLCCCKSKKKLDLSSENLNTFMNSAMNIEFVLLILKSVRNFMNRDPALMNQ
jgi:hypothetical protein